MAEQAISQLAEQNGPTKLLVLTYHPLSDELGIQKSEARKDYYLVRGFPAIVFNGIEKISGASSVSEMVKRYDDKINLVKEGDSGVTLQMNGKIESRMAQVEVSITLDKKTSLAGMSYRWVLFERRVRGQRGIYHNVVRDMSEVYTNVKPGTTKTVPVYFSLPASATGDNWGLALLIQDDSTKKIVAAASTLLIGVAEEENK